ncbi:MAG: hypothetical protein ACI85O_001824 [Saprospiraceae bacterium]|jgi:hypothetical protein
MIKPYTTKLAIMFFFLMLPFLMFGQIMVPYLMNEQYGYSDLNGNIKIDPSYDKVSFFNSNGYATVEINAKMHIIDTLGNSITDIKGSLDNTWKFDKVTGLKSGYWRVRNDSMRMIIDKDFNLIFKTKFLLGLPDKNLQCSVIKRKINKRAYEYAVIKRDGSYVIPWTKHKVWITNTNVKKDSRLSLIVMKTNTSCNVYNLKGIPFIDSCYEEIKTLKLDSLNFYYLKSGNVVDIVDDSLRIIYSDLNLHSFSDKSRMDKLIKDNRIYKSMLVKVFNLNKKIKCSITPSGHFFCIEKKGKEEIVYTNGTKILREGEKFHFYNPSNERVYFKKGDKWGVKNLMGNTVFPLTDKEIGKLYEIKNIVTKIGDVYQFYTQDGVKIENALYSDYNKYKIKNIKSGKYALHKADGIPLTDFIFDEVKRIRRKLILCSSQKSFTFFDFDGNKIFNIKADSIKQSKNKRYFEYYKNGKIGIFETSGKLILKALYVSISYTNPISGKSIFEVTDETGQLRHFNPEGNILNLRIKEGEKFQIIKHNKGYIRIIYKEMGISEFYNPEGKLLTTEKKFKSISIGNRSEFGLIKVNGKYYFNVRNGISYRN